MEIAPTPFQAYVAPAAASGRGWARLALGILILIAGYVLASILVLIPFGIFLFGRENRVLQSEELKGMLFAGGPESVFALLASLALLWPVLNVVCRAVHNQRFATLFSPEGRIRWRDFRTGAALAIGLALLGYVVALALVGLPERAPLSLATWAALALPLAILVFLQTAAEELVFRGYLLQRLAVLSKHPVLWALLPSLGFAALHYGPDLPGGIVGVAGIFLFALICCALVFQTGSLSAAMGFHAGTNLMGLSVAGTRDYLSGMQLFLYDPKHTMSLAFIDIVVLSAALAFVLWAGRSARTP